MVVRHINMIPGNHLMHKLTTFAARNQVSCHLGHRLHGKKPTLSALRCARSLDIDGTFHVKGRLNFETFMVSI